MCNVKLIHGDCLEQMDKLIEKGIKFDAIITDPPYGTTACRWDEIIPFEEMWLRLKQLRYNYTPIILFGSEPFSSKLRCSNLSEFRYDWIWNKKKPSNFQQMNFQNGRIHEIISVFGEGKCVYIKNKNNLSYYPQKEKRDKPKVVNKTFYGNKNATLREGHTIKDLVHKEYNYRLPYSIIEFSNANIKSKIHPTEKPVELLKYLIKTYTKENELILDFTMGSASTGIACIDTNRNFIGIEKDDKYFDISCDRINNYIKDNNLENVNVEIIK